MIVYKLLVLCYFIALAKGKQPNVVFIMADDLGWNDVSWHNKLMPTPNLEKLAFRRGGVLLNNSYVNFLCTQTRTAFMTGHYPYVMGLQQGVFQMLEPSGVPLTYPFLPEFMSEAGYKTYMVGKWHLGYCKESYTPIARGFDRFYGYFAAQQDYYTHLSNAPGAAGGAQGLDLWQQNTPDSTQNGTYSTDLFLEKTGQFLQHHNKSDPLFLYFAFQSVHAPLEVPDKYMKPCLQIEDSDRRLYCGMINTMDQTVGKLVDQMKVLGLYEDTIFIFSSDNGGNIQQSGNNYPLRGNKATLWEGGVRAVTFVHSPKYVTADGIRDNLFSIVDWLATIVNIGGKKFVGYGSGVNQLDMILHNNQTGLRTEMVYNVDTQGTNNLFTGGSAIRVGDYKLIMGHPGLYNGWNPPDRGQHLGQLMDNSLILDKWKTVYLFDIKNDPLERYDLSLARPSILKLLMERLKSYQFFEANSIHKPNDPKGAPVNGTYTIGWC